MINIMAKAALKAARGLVRDFGEVSNLQTSRQGPGGFISSSSRSAEQALYRTLFSVYPHHNFLLKETGEKRGNGDAPWWIIDALDGAENFLHGVPHCSMSLALRERSETVAGMVYDPIKDELFWAHKGMGSFLNQQRIRVSHGRGLSDSLLATSLPNLKEGKKFPKVFEVLQNLTPKTLGVRCPGALSLNLAYVAAGRYDGVWECAAQPWNISAGILLIKEAGGFISDLSGGQDMLKTGGIVAGNETIYRFLQDALRGAHVPN